jgi:hypothetical protein
MTVDQRVAEIIICAVGERRPGILSYKYSLIQLQYVEYPLHYNS